MSAAAAIDASPVARRENIRVGDILYSVETGNLIRVTVAQPFVTPQPLQGRYNIRGVGGCGGNTDREGLVPNNLAYKIITAELARDLQS
jgi:hypothetical protein